MGNQSWYHGFFDEAPYKDNWLPSKNYLSLGFLPGYALQSRELLELQTTILYQISTTNRSSFLHGQPRIDLEEESLTEAAKSPILVNTQTQVFSIAENTQIFTNFSLAASAAALSIPNGFWITIPPSSINFTNNVHLEVLDSTPSENAYVGFTVEVVAVDSVEDESLLDPAGTDFKNNNAPGATRYAYKIVSTGDNKFLSSNSRKRNQGEFFVPIAQWKNGSYYWAFDESTQIPAISP
tara:strand:- start:161 stop:874 length:714 start_codon:yes stop_codon:yes gene_type:complete